MATVRIDIQEPYLSLVLTGQKTVEGRLYKGKFKDLRVGDFLLVGLGEKEFLVSKLTRYPSFEEMIAKEGIAAVTPDKRTVDEAVAVYRSFYSVEAERECGVLAIGLESAEKIS